MDGKRYIIQDFFEAFRIKKLKWNDGRDMFLMVCIYIFLLSSWIIPGIEEGRVDGNRIITLTAVLLPIFLNYWSIYAHPVKLNKIMYLCPLDPEERKEYIYGTYFFRIGLHILLSLVGLCIVVPITYCDIFSCIQILLNDLMAAFIIISAPVTVNGISNMSGIEVVIFSTTIISNIVECGIIMDENPDIAVKIVLFGVFLLIQLPCAIAYMKSVKKVLKSSIYYEAQK